MPIIKLLVNKGSVVKLSGVVSPPVDCNYPYSKKLYPKLYMAVLSNIMRENPKVSIVISVHRVLIIT